MDLHVTLAAGPGVFLPGGGPTEELVITDAHLLSGHQISEQLSDRTGAEHLLVEGEPLGRLEPGTPPLTPGAVIVASTTGHVNARSARAGGLFFLVRSGPDAGKAVPLTRGSYTIGRGDADIPIHDPELSRIHAVLTVADDVLTLHDRNSANGVWVDGSRVERTAVTTTSDVRMGSSRCALVLDDTPIDPPLPTDLTEPCTISAPLPPDNQWLLVLTAFLPLVLGIVLALATGMWFFLAFSALSAVTGLIPLINGRRKSRAFQAAAAEAVAEDSERRRRAAPDAGALSLAALQRSLPVPTRPPQPHSDGCYLSLGNAEQPAGVELKPKSPAWQPPLVNAPVLIPLLKPGSTEPLNLDIRGPRQTLILVAHLLLLQLSTLHRAGNILCYGQAGDLPHAARFLPRVTLVANPIRFNQLLATNRYSSVLLFGTNPIVPEAGCRIYRFSSSTAESEEEWSVDYFPSQPILATPAGPVPFTPDFIRLGTFDVLARAGGTETGPGTGNCSGASVPEAVALSDLLDDDTSIIAQRWQAVSDDDDDAAQLRTPVGSSAAGSLVLDLVADGPHLLVAGTTGSGKSELLRTLVLGLALTYSPAQLNFLFIDFKGGSGLGSLVPLPQVTGMLTDLSAAEVTRALVSLRAEVKRREGLFAHAGVTDFAAYRERTSTPLPRLVTVIDEFRMLSEEVPGSVNELMRIAALGRSLGMHLVLATQRPQGAVTSDIRANITASIALRMQSGLESQDVLESAVAASIPVELPGRAYLRVGSRKPVEFQTATVVSDTESRSATVMSLAAFLEGRSGPHREGTDLSAASGTGRRNGVERVLSAVTTAAEAVPLPPLRGPVCPPLPRTVSRTPDVPSGIPLLGRLDIPERQEQRPLLWDPVQHSHLALVGQSGSGLGSALSHLASDHVRALPERHLYLLDGDGSVRAVMDVPQTGAYVGASEVKRAARVLQRISQLVADRCSAVPVTPELPPHLTLFISGWGRWVTSFRTGRFAAAEDALQEIVRDGEAAGVSLVVAGERELISSRFFPMVPNRLYLPAGASPDALLGWPKLPPIDAVPGRAYVQGRISAGIDAVAQLITQGAPVPSVQPARKPFTVAVLPQVVRSCQLGPADPGVKPAGIPVGVGGDDLAPVHLVLPHRTAALVVGAAGTGKTQTLDLIEGMAPSSLRCLRPGARDSPETFWKSAALEGGTRTDLLLVDDADLLARETHQHIAAMLANGARAVIASQPSPVLATSPATAALRLNPVGIVLGPRSASDGEILGLRLDADGVPPPGRGVLVEAGRVIDVQIALRQERTGSGLQ